MEEEHHLLTVLSVLIELLSHTMANQLKDAVGHILLGCRLKRVAFGLVEFLEVVSDVKASSTACYNRNPNN